MFCPKCGKPLAEGMQFCGACGARLGAGNAKPAGDIAVPWGFVLVALIGLGIQFIFGAIVYLLPKLHVRLGYSAYKTIQTLSKVSNLATIAVVLLIAVVFITQIGRREKLPGVGAIIGLIILLLGYIPLMLAQVFDVNLHIHDRTIVLLIMLAMPLGMLIFTAFFIFHEIAQKRGGFLLVASILSACMYLLVAIVLLIGFLTESEPLGEVYNILNLLAMLVFGIFLVALLIRQRQRAAA